jgi:hypothetical protein
MLTQGYTMNMQKNSCIFGLNKNAKWIIVMAISSVLLSFIKQNI